MNKTNKKSFAKRAKELINKYSRASFDPTEKQELEAALAKLAEEQEAYKQANGIGEYSPENIQAQQMQQRQTMPKSVQSNGLPMFDIGGNMNVNFKSPYYYAKNAILDYSTILDNQSRKSQLINESNGIPISGIGVAASIRPNKFPNVDNSNINVGDELSFQRWVAGLNDIPFNVSGDDLRKRYIYSTMPNVQSATDKNFYQSGDTRGDELQKPPLIDFMSRSRNQPISGREINFGVNTIIPGNNLYGSKEVPLDSVQGRPQNFVERYPDFRNMDDMGKVRWNYMLNTEYARNPFPERLLPNSPLMANQNDRYRFGPEGEQSNPVNFTMPITEEIPDEIVNQVEVKSPINQPFTTIGQTQGILPSVLSGLASSVGNIVLGATTKPIQFNKAYTPEQISLAKERDILSRNATIARNIAARNYRNAGSRGAYMAGIGATGAGINQQLGDAMSQSYMKEGLTNLEQRNKANELNRGIDMVNYQARVQADQDKKAYVSQAINSLVSAGTDINRILGQNALIESIGAQNYMTAPSTNKKWKDLMFGRTIKGTLRK